MLSVIFWLLDRILILPLIDVQSGEGTLELTFSTNSFKLNLLEYELVLYFLFMPQEKKQITNNNIIILFINFHF